MSQPRRPIATSHWSARPVFSMLSVLVLALSFPAAPAAGRQPDPPKGTSQVLPFFSQHLTDGQ